MPLLDTRAATSGSMSSQNLYAYDGAAPIPVSAPKAAPKAPPSTGGTHEPNDQPYGDVFFHNSGVNPFIDTEDDRLSTFGLDVDTGSYNVARRYLTDGNLPPAKAIRVEEFVNAFDYGDPASARGDFAPAGRRRADAVSTCRATDTGSSGFTSGRRDVSEAGRKPATLTFVVDVSGSMEQGNRLELVKRALGLLLDRLRARR